MFKILDGRSEFYQWDLNRKIVVEDATITEVHFCNKTDDCSLVVEVVDGLANVPNILLQDNFRINVYGYDGEATKHSATFGVKPRSKPADYVYTETEIKRWEDIEQSVKDLEKSLSKYQLKPEYLVAISPEDTIKIWELATGIYRFSGYIYTRVENGEPTGALNYNENSVLIVNKRYAGKNQIFNWFILGEFVNHYTTGYVPIKTGYFYVSKNGNITSNEWKIQGDALIQDIEANNGNMHTYPSSKAVVDYVNTVIGGVENGTY